MQAIEVRKKVLLAEDHPLVADATRTLLLKIDPSLDIRICDTADSAVQTFREGGHWHRVFLDINLPNAHGLSLVRTFHRFGVADKSAVVTAFDNAQWRSEVNAMGMLGYIVKAARLEDFASAMQDVLLGCRTFPQVASAEPSTTRLTRRQQDILCLLHRGLASKEIAAQLGLTIGTVNNHVTGLLRVLGVSNRMHAVSRAFQLGYLHDHDAPRACWN